MSLKATPVFVLVLCLALCGASCRRARPIAIPERAHGSFDLATGLYVRRTIDLALTGNPDLVLTRTYRNRDNRSRPFGIGTNDDYDEFLVGEYPKWLEVVGSDGGTIHYVRRPGAGMIFDNTDGSPGYGHSTIEQSFSGRYWYLKRADGSKKTFLSCTTSSGPLQCGLVEIRDPAGNVVKIKRDAKGNATRIANDIGWIKLEYDSSDRVTTATASTGESARYFYDGPGRLVKVEYSSSEVFHYEYDPRNNMTKVVEPGWQVINAYDDKGYGIEQQVSSGWHYQFSYAIDKDGKTLSTKATTTSILDLHAEPVVSIDYFDRDGWVNKEVWDPDTDHATTALLAREPDTGEPHVISGSCKVASREFSLEPPMRHPGYVDEIEDLRRQCLSMAAKANPVHKPHQSVPVKMGLWDVTIRQEATAPPEMAAAMKKDCSLRNPTLPVTAALPVQTISPVTQRMHSCMDEASWR